MTNFKSVLEPCPVCGLPPVRSEWAGFKNNWYQWCCEWHLKADADDTEIKAMQNWNRKVQEIRKGMGDDNT